jgi:hypothetical protein
MAGAGAQMLVVAARALDAARALPAGGALDALWYSLFLTHTHTLVVHSLLFTRTLSLSLTHAFSLSHTNTIFCKHVLPIFLSLSLSHTLFLSHTFSLSLSLRHTHTLAHVDAARALPEGGALDALWLQPQP